MIVPLMIYFIVGAPKPIARPSICRKPNRELVAGFHTEYSGFRWALSTCFPNTSTCSLSASVMMTLFWGGWLRPFPSVALARRAAELRLPAAGVRRLRPRCLPLVKRQLTRLRHRNLPDCRCAAPVGAAALFMIPVVNAASVSGLLVLPQALRGHVHLDLVPRHIPTLPLRPADEHRLEGDDPDCAWAPSSSTRSSAC